MLSSNPTDSRHTDSFYETTDLNLEYRRERRYREAALERDLLAAFLESVEPGLCLIDAEGLFVRVNHTFAGIHGYEAHELLGRSFTMVTRPEDREHMLHLHNEVLRGNRVSPFEALTARKDGKAIWTRITSHLVRHEDRSYRATSVTDITEHKNLEHELHALAVTDPLTGVANRRHFLDVALLEVHRSRRTGHSPAIVMVDLDRFKEINDSAGHAAGDRVLQEFSMAVRRHLRSSDTLGRLGGEEFAILLPEADLDTAAEVAGRVRTAVAELTVPAPGGELQFTASFGVSRLRAGETSIEAAMHRADVALYRAKDAGRNAVMVDESE